MILPITVIIPTMNRPESLGRTLKCMAEAKDVPQQIIVVDQSQDDGICSQNKRILDGFEIIPSRVYEYQQKPSSTKARNIGLSKANNEILVFSDDDVDVHKDTFTNIAYLMEEKSLAMIAGIDELTQKSQTNVGYLLGTKSFFKRKIGHVTCSMLGRYPDSISAQTDTQWAQGYFFVVRKSCIERWNLKWDENLTSYAYAEDLDFSYSYYKCAKREKLRCVIDPMVTVKHLATLEFRVPSMRSLYMYIVNRKYLAYKHGMGFKGVIGRNWCEFWRFIQQMIHRQEPKIFLKAYFCKFKYAKEINAGHLDYDKFMKQ